MRGNPITGAGYLVKGLKMLPDPEIRPFVIVPLLINVVLFIAAFWVLFSQMGGWIDGLLSYLPDWASFLHWFLWPLFALMVLLVAYYSFSIVANLIAAPFNGFLSEKVEKRLRGELVVDEGWKALLAMVPRSIQRELAKLVYYLPRVLFLLILSFIPVINVISPLLWLWFGAWMMAIQYCDYPMDNNKVSFGQMKLLLKQERLTAIGFGGLIQACMLVPLLNLLIMPAAVVGATLYWVEAHAGEERPLPTQGRLNRA